MERVRIHSCRGAACNAYDLDKLDVFLHTFTVDCVGKCRYSRMLLFIQTIRNTGCQYEWERLCQEGCEFITVLEQESEFAEQMMWNVLLVILSAEAR